MYVLLTVYADGLSNFELVLNTLFFINRSSLSLGRSLPLEK